jgi:hypothetical protein
MAQPKQRATELLLDGRVVWRVSTAILPLLIVTAAAAHPASAKGASGSFVGLGTPGGITVPRSDLRYTALSPRTSGRRVTVVAGTDRRGGRVARWWHLRGTYLIPAVAYDGSSGGLSADGSTLVLSREERSYPPKMSRFAILRTRLHLRHHGGAGRGSPRHAMTHIGLPGDFSFDAISPDGSTVYLIHHLPGVPGPEYITNYEVRSIDTATGRLNAAAIVDPTEPNERMEGLPITRANSPDGRWAYTLYDGNGKEPFLHALDTVAGQAVCVELPQLANRRNTFMLALGLGDGGRTVSVYSRPATQRGRSQTLLRIDTGTFEVSRPAPGATARSCPAPWLAAGLAAIGLAVVLAWSTHGKSGARPSRREEQA